jgi:quercetin dioxygenase-like cupin family protein
MFFNVKQGASNKGAATGSREFEVLFDASKGSSAATMFIGFIPPSGAPDHYHLYDEICQIVSGTGSVAVDGENQDISTGSTFSITPRLLHSIVNNGTEDLWLLGIFRPQGSPAAAYYPDGRPAPGYSETE